MKQVKAMKQVIEFRPAFDKRHKDPNKNHGIHGVELAFYLIGDKGVIQFVVSTNWQLPHVQKEMDDRSPDPRFPYLHHKPMAMDLGYHSPRRMYEGQTPMDDCRFFGGKCYYDGSSEDADDVFKVLCLEGHDGVWREMKKYYKSRFLTRKATK